MNWLLTSLAFYHLVLSASFALFGMVKLIVKSLVKATFT